MLIAWFFDLERLATLELCGYFPEGFTRTMGAHGFAYLDRIVWLREKRELPGALPYPGPMVTYNGLQ